MDNLRPIVVGRPAALGQQVDWTAARSFIFDVLALIDRSIHPTPPTLQARAEHGVYGYSVPLEEVTQEVVRYLERTAHYKARGVISIDACWRMWELTAHLRILSLVTQIKPEWIVWSHGLVPALTVASRMAGGEGDAVMVRLGQMVRESAPNPNPQHSTRSFLMHGH
jgi:bifunctional pyridoxal-dependent enzyme with beta-cystathionase and maltose regulon repressor activities